MKTEPLTETEELSPELTQFFADLKTFATADVEPRQLAIAGSPYEVAEAARKPLETTEKLLRADGFRLLKEPFKASNALFVARSNCMQALQLMADPSNPCLAAVIAAVATANAHLDAAQVALDPETNKTLSDATLSVAKALKAVSTALEKLEDAMGE